MNKHVSPKYLIVKNDLKKLAIEQSEGYRIPVIAELIKHYGVSSTTVLRAIKDLITEGYLITIQGNGTFVAKPKPKNTASQSRNIGLVITDMVKTTHPVLAKLISSVSLFAKKYNYNIVLIPERIDRLFGPHSAKLEQDLEDEYYAGLLLISPLKLEDFSRLFEINIPFVNITNEYFDERIYSVSTDHYNNTHLEVNYCARKGCKNILYIAGPPSMNGYRMIFSAYRTCMLECGLNFNEANLRTTDYSENQAYDIVMDRFSKPSNHPDAIIAYDNVLAGGIYRALKELDVKVKEDVLLVQGNELFTDPTMRSIVSYLDLQHDKTHRQATEMIIKLIQGEEIPEKTVYIYSTLVECPSQ